MPVRPSATDELHTLGSLLRAPFDAMVDHNYRMLAKTGFGDVRPAHGAVLRHISRNGSRLTELAERAHMTKQSMAELVEHLRAGAYVELLPDAGDRRAKLVKLTERGWQVHRALVMSSRAFERVCARGMGAGKWHQLRALLQEFADWSSSAQRSRREGA